jgi:hypothetical protein
MKRSLLAIAWALLSGFCAGMAVGVHGQSVIRKQLDKSNEQFNSLHDSFVRMEKAATDAQSAYKQLEDVNHRNEAGIKTCLAGWNRAIVDIQRSTAFINGMAARNK